MSLKRFNKEFDKVTSIALKGSEKAIQNAVGNLFEAVIKDTPVDTGQLKGNWEASINKPITTQFIGRLDKNGEQTITKVKAVLKSTKISEQKLTKMYLSNNLDYANRIEYGQYSSKAPYGMVRVNVLRFKSEIDKAAKKFKV